MRRRNSMEMTRRAPWHCPNLAAKVRRARFFTDHRIFPMTRLGAAAIAITTLVLAAARPAAAADISGVWLIDTADAHIKMAQCGANMCGSIVWIKDPIDAKTGKPPTDEKNPDPTKRSRPLVGIQIAVGFHTTADNHDKYVGEFYNAEDGKTYR